MNQSADSFGQNSGLSNVLSAEAISSETLKAGSSGEIEEGSMWTVWETTGRQYVMLTLEDPEYID